MSQSNAIDKVTAIVKTFERPKELNRLIDSIRKFYPTLRVMVADDSKTPYARSDVDYYALPYDSGISAGRNFMVQKVQTQYLLQLDDDFVFTENTKLEKMITILETQPIDLVAGDVINEGRERLIFHGFYEFRDGFLFHYIGPYRRMAGPYPLYDSVLQFFMVKTDKLRGIPWDENIKCSREHADFFLRCRDQLNITRLPEFSVDHYQGHKYYLGERGAESIRIFNNKWKIIDKIEIRKSENRILDFVKAILRSVRILKKRIVHLLFSRNGNHDPSQ